MSDQKKIDQIFENAKSNIINNLNKVKEYVSGRTGSGGSIEKVYTPIMKIASSNDQISIIKEMLEGISGFCARTAIFLIKEDKLKGWGGAGFTNNNSDISDREVKKIFFSLTADTVFRNVLKSKKIFEGSPDQHKDNHLIFNRFGHDVPLQILVLPFFVKGKPQAVLYSDSYENEGPFRHEIEMISLFGEMSLDLLPLRQKINARVKTQEYDDDSENEPILLTEETNREQKKESKKLSNAERLAKVIVNDIILYNKKQVEDARAEKKLYKILGDTIEQSKEIFLNKFDDLTPFETQLLETLAAGNRDALNGYKFEKI